jgi:hypothetical protein
MAKKVLIIEECDSIDGGRLFKVVRVKNRISPSVGSTLQEAEVQDIIDAGTEVIIDLPRKRA